MPNEDKKGFVFKVTRNKDLMWNLALPDGKSFGSVSYDAYKAVESGTLDKYKPKNNSEKSILEKYKKWTGYGKTYNTVATQYGKDKYGKGNIDLTSRPIYTNNDGKISTVDSITVGIDNKQVLLPTIVRDEKGQPKRLETADDAVKHYQRTGEYLGKFDTIEEADEYANSLHIDQALYYENVDADAENRKHLIINDYVPKAGNSTRSEYARQRSQNPDLPVFGSYEYFKRREKQLKSEVEKIANDPDRDDEVSRGWAESYGKDNNWMSNKPEMNAKARELYYKFQYQDAILEEYKDIDAQLKKFEKKGVHTDASGEVDAKSGAEEAKYAKDRAYAIASASLLPMTEEFSGYFGDLPADKQKAYDEKMQIAGQARVEHEKEKAYDYYEKNKDNTYANNIGGRIAGNYKVGRIGIKSNDAGFTSFTASSDDIEASEVYQLLSSRIQNRNKSTFTDNTKVQKFVTTVSQYAPQAVDQAVYKFAGNVVGGIIGSASGAGMMAGASVGGSTAAAAYMYRQTTGASFVRMLQENNLSVEDAKILARNEGIASSVVEFGLDYASNLLWWGGSKVAGGALEESAKKYISKASQKTTKALTSIGISEKGAKTIMNVAKNAGKITLNATGEGMEEWIQEGMSITADRYAKEGKTGSVFSLFADTFDLSQYSADDFSRMNQSFLAGALIGFAHGGLNATSSIGADKVISGVTNAVDSYKVGKTVIDAGDVELVNDFVDRAKVIDDEKLAKTVEQIETALAEDKTPSAKAVGTLIKDVLAYELDKLSKGVSIGDSFIDSKYGITITVVDRDDNNTTVEINNGTKVETKVITNQQANTLIINSQYKPIKQADTQNIPKTASVTTENIAETNDFADTFTTSESGRIQFNQTGFDHDNKTMQKGQFRIMGKEGSSVTVDGIIRGKYGIYKKDSSKNYAVTLLQSGLDVGQFKTLNEAKQFATYLDDNLSFNDITYIANSKGSHDAVRSDEFKAYLGAVRQALNDKPYTDVAITDDVDIAEETQETKEQTPDNRESVEVKGKGTVKWDTLHPRQKQAIVFAEGFAKAANLKLVLVANAPTFNGAYDVLGDTMYLDIYAGVNPLDKASDLIIPTLSHELTHWMHYKAPAIWEKLRSRVFSALEEVDGISESERIKNEMTRLKSKGLVSNESAAVDEIVARACEDMLAKSEQGKKIFNSLSESEQQTLRAKIKELIAKLKDWISDFSSTYAPSYRYEPRVLQMCESKIDEIAKLWDEGIAESVKVSRAETKIESSDPDVIFDQFGIQFDADSKSIAPSTLFSEKTWKASEYVQDEKTAIKAIMKATGVSEADAKRYIRNINSIARLIADDRARLDYDSNIDDTATVLKSNSEYKWTVDMSTLCAKRLLTTGTFDAIQKALPNTVFNSEDIVKLRSMMVERGYEVACGICYVESTRRELGPITQEFINRYKLSQETGQPITRINSKGKAVELTKTKEQMETTVDKSTDKFIADKNYTPTLAELNTTDIDLVKRDHPLVYEAYLNFMNARGQAKPKLLETRAEYKGEILKVFKNKNTLKARNAAGGLRVQSFSDFEIAHLIDMMQITLDMSVVGLKSQAYTKVPAFADVFGGTGIKINLSLIAKDSGLDEKGNLIFDDVEGMPHKEAFRLRDKYSKNVGTILVGKNDAHIKAALADPRIDFVIPFHKSSWKESLYDALGLEGYTDYTDWQNEKQLDENGNPTKEKIANIQPSEYWRYDLSGEENEKIYLDMCKEQNRRPKFPQFIGCEGYWKLLIDFKMYDNDGVGSPQTEVMPEFDMESAIKIMNEYEGGHQKLPVAKDVVEDFVEEYKNQSGLLLSEKDSAEALSVKEQIAQNHSKLDSMGVVARIDTNAELKNADDAYAWAFAQLKQSGDRVERKDFGVVILDEKRIKNGFRYIGTHQEYAALALIPKVIKRGITLDGHNNHKGRGYGTVTFGAPVEIDGLRCDMAVVVRMEGKNYYKLHRVIMSDGISSKNKKRSNAERAAATTTVVDTPTDSASKTNIPQPDKKVKGNLLLSEKDSEGNELSKEQIEFFKDSQVRWGNSLMPVYHGAKGQFTVFDNTEWSHEEHRSGGLNWAAKDVEYAKDYSYADDPIVLKGYLNITKMLDIGAIDSYLDRNKRYQEVADAIKLTVAELESMVDFRGTSLYDITSSKKFKDRIVELGYDGVKALESGLTTYGFVDSNQFKSVDNKNPTANPDILLSEKDDADYVNTVKKGDMDTAQKMVDEAAKKAGFPTKLYHGTAKFGFTKTDVSKSDDGISFFATDSLELAQTYSGVVGETQIKRNPSQSDENRQRYDGLVKNFVDTVNTVAGRELLKTDDLPFERYIKQVKKGKMNLDQVSSKMTDYTLEIIDSIEQHKRISPEDEKNLWNLSTELETALYALNGDSGNYGLYANTENFFEIDGNGSAWSSIPFDKIPSKATANTREIVKWAKDNGYSGVLFKNIYDIGYHGSTQKNPANVYAFFKPQEQTKSADPVTYDALGRVIPLSKRFNKQNRDLRFSEKDTAPTFYSHMANVIDDIKQDKVGASSVIPYLTGRGVKAEEIKWSGIETFLDGKKSVTKAELQEFAQGSMLQIETKELVGKHTIDYTEDESKSLDEISEVIGEKWQEIDTLWEEKYGDDIPWDIRYADNATDLLYREISRRQRTDTDSKEFFDKIESDLDRIHTLENNQYHIVQKAEMRMRVHRTKYDNYKLDGGVNYRELLFKIPGNRYKNDAMDAHWQESGVLAHARVQDFEVDGQKMLFIEEIQSDWHNEGHKKGYREVSKTMESEKATEEYYAAVRKFQEARNAHNNDYHNPELREEYEMWRSRVEELADKRAEASLAAMRGAEDAPFRDNYHEYVLKNLIRMAAEQGYDSIGWTTADIQSNRWSDQYAEGYRIEYDQDIPKFLSKYGKKWGAKVGYDFVNPLRNSEKRIAEYETDIANYKAQLEEIGDDASQQEYIDFLTEGIADMEQSIERVKGTKIWTMPITDAMKESVLYEGQPLYSMKDDGVPDLFEAWDMAEIPTAKAATNSRVKNTNAMANQSSTIENEWLDTDTTNPTADKISSVSELIKDIHDSFGITIKSGKVTDRRASGIYKILPEVIRTRIANDLPTIIHELGHHLNKKYHLEKSQHINEAESLLNVDVSAYSKDELPGEIAAEFVRRYFKNPDAISKTCPNLTKDFLSLLDKKDAKSVSRIAPKVNKYLSSTAGDRYGATNIDSKQAKRLDREDLTDKASDLYTYWVSQFHPIKQLVDFVEESTGGKSVGEKNAYKLATNSLNAHNISNYVLLDKFRDLDGNVISGYNSFVDCIGEVDMTDKKTRKAFSEYLKLKHALEVQKKGKRVFADEVLGDVKNIDARLDKLRRAYPKFEQASKNLYEFQYRVLSEFAVKAGLMTQEQVDFLHNEYPCYVPFYRYIKGKKGSFARKALVNQGDITKKMKGSGLDTLDPIESIVMNTEKIITASMRHQVADLLGRYADTVDGVGSFIERIPPDQVAKRVGIADLKEKFTDKLQGIIKSSDDYFAISDLVDEVFGDFAIGYTPVVNEKKGVFAVKRGDDISYYQVHNKSLLESITELSPKQSNAIVKALRFTNALITQYNPLFSLTNPIRDIMTAYDLGDIDNPAEFVKDYAKAIKYILFKSEDWEQFKAMGGGHASRLNAELGAISKSVKDLQMKDKGRARRLAYAIFRHPLQTLTAVSDFTESIPRFMTFMQTYEKTGDLQEAIYQADDITTNFKRRGSGTGAKAVNGIFRFNNAAIQGLDKTARTITEADNKRKVKVTAKWLTESILIALLLNFFNRERDEEGWENLSAYKKNNFYNISLGDGMFLSLPKERENAVLNSLVERTVDALCGEDDAFYDFGGYLVSQFLPPMAQGVPELATGDLMGAFHTTANSTLAGPIVDIGFNKDFKGSPIESEYEQDLLSSERYNGSTSALAKWLGQTKFAVDNDLSPKKIDHLLGSLGFLQSANKALFPADDKNRDLTVGLRNRFITDSKYSTDVLNKVYENRDLAKKDYLFYGTVDKAMDYEQNAVVSSYISGMNKAIRALPEDEQRKGRAYLLKNLNDWDYEQTKSQSAMLDSLKGVTKGTSLDDVIFDSLPSSEFSWTVDKQNYTYQMTPQEYDEYIKGYINIIESARQFYGGDSIDSYEKAKSAAKEYMSDYKSKVLKKKYLGKSKKTEK